MEFSAVGQIDCGAGNLYFNDQDRGDWFFLTGPNDPSGSIATEGWDGADIRTSQFNRSQADGLIVRPSYLGGIHATLGGRIIASGVTDRNEKEDILKGVFGSMLRADGNIRFTPTGLDERFMTIRAENNFIANQVDGLLHAAGMGFVSRVQPFWRLFGEGDVTINSGDSGTVTNSGNAPAWAVYQITDPGSHFQIDWTWPDSTAFSMNWLLPSGFDAGSYLELVTYEGTMYVDGNGDNALGGLDSDFDMPPLMPGANTVALSGDFGSVVVKTNSSYF